ncbi:TylF/MycF/NovP-related O-methyltransferase [Helicobacter saguini]|uniref:TylF/MycF/NovP-related O-methyltransferase n=1 Tax=Helicobacter saguini TaxID=1548018 RepID=UPI00192754EC|nr:TylF/MycF/NovP-related O-methyltransferase [Helicobacter saguini]
MAFNGGGGVMAFAKLCASLDIFNINRKVIGFDTFCGFPNVSKQDLSSKDDLNALKKGGFNSFESILDEMQDCIDEFDSNRFLNQFIKIELVKGDATQTIPQYVEKNPHILISLLFLDFDLYEPTKVALECLAHRVVKGGIIAFDEINNDRWHGESVAALEYFKSFNKCEIKSFSFEPNISYMIVE